MIETCMIKFYLFERLQTESTIGYSNDIKLIFSLHFNEPYDIDPTLQKMRRKKTRKYSNRF